MGFDHSATPGETWSKFMKNLSKIAHVRRRHDPKTFKLHWTVRIGMAIAKHGARVALARAAAIRYDIEEDVVTAHGTENAPFEPQHAAPPFYAEEGDARGG